MMIPFMLFSPQFPPAGGGKFAFFEVVNDGMDDTFDAAQYRKNLRRMSMTMVG